MDAKKTLFVNAWDMLSIPGNGNKGDSSLDGRIGRVTNIALNGTSMTNPYLINTANYIQVEGNFQYKLRLAPGKYSGLRPFQEKALQQFLRTGTSDYQMVRRNKQGELVYIDSQGKSFLIIKIN